MKSITAGGNVHCMINEEQFYCSGGNMDNCIDACIAVEEEFGDSCGGCAQFPVIN